MSALASALRTIRPGGFIDLAPAPGYTLAQVVTEAVAALDGRDPGRIVRGRNGAQLRVTAAVAGRLVPAAGTSSETDKPAAAPKRRTRRKTNTATEAPAPAADETENKE